MTPSFCRSCGREIVWATTQHGKPVPLDPKALVFSVIQEGTKLIAVKPSGGAIGERWMASHIDVCPDKFNGNKPPPERPHNMLSAEMRPPERHFSEQKEVDPTPCPSCQEQGSPACLCGTYR